MTTEPRGHGGQRPGPSVALELPVHQRPHRYGFGCAHQQARKAHYDVEDVLHSFYVPNFRVKQTLCRARTRASSSRPPAGGPQIYCTEFCGTSHPICWAGHRRKRRRVRAVAETGKIPDGKYRITYGDPQQLAVAAPFKRRPRTMVKLIASKGCVTCHSVDGTPKAPPSRAVLAAMWNLRMAARPWWTGLSQRVHREFQRESGQGLRPHALYKGTSLIKKCALVAYIKTS